MCGCDVCDVVTLEWDDTLGFGLSFQTEVGRGKRAKDNVHRITHVDKNSPAGRANLKVDSIIIQVNHVDTLNLNRRGLSKLIQDARAGPASFHCRIQPNKMHAANKSASGLLDRLSRALSGKSEAAPKKKKKKKKRRKDLKWDWLSRFTRSPATSPLPVERNTSDPARSTFQFGEREEPPASPSRLKSWQNLLRRKSSNSGARSHLKSSMSLRRKESLNSQESSSSCGNPLSSSPTSRSMVLPGYSHPPHTQSVSPSASMVSTDESATQSRRPSSWHVSHGQPLPMSSLSVSPSHAHMMQTPQINVTPSTPSPKLPRQSIGARSLDSAPEPSTFALGAQPPAHGDEATSRTAASSPLWSTDNSPYTSPCPPALFGDEYTDPAMYPPAPTNPTLDDQRTELSL